jgi:tetratricopeptide (TPR) repeat protein
MYVGLKGLNCWEHKLSGLATTVVRLENDFPPEVTLRFGMRSLLMAGFLVVGMTGFVWPASSLAQEKPKNVIKAQEKTEDLAELLRRADAELQSGAYERARDTARRAVKADPKSAEAQLLLGRAYTFLEDYDRALRAIERAEKNGARVALERGVAQYRAGQITAARNSLAKAVQDDPTDADAYYFQGLARHAGGDHAGARKALARARELDADLAPETHYFSAIAALGEGQRDLARAELGQALTLAPSTGVGRLAKDLLDEIEGRKRKSYEVRLSLRNETDTNVLLVPLSGGLFSEEEISGRGGNRMVLRAGGAWLPGFAEGIHGTLGYNLYQSFHLTNRERLDRFDVTNHAFTTGVTYDRDGHYITLPYQYSIAYLGPLDGDGYGRYSQGHVINPAYMYRVGGHGVGVSNALGFENFDFEAPALTVGDELIDQGRDSLFNEISAFYSFFFADGAGTLSPYGSWLYSGAQGENNPWSYTGWRAGLQAGIPLSERWRWGGRAAFTQRTYTNPYPLRIEGAYELTDRSDDELAYGTDIRFEGHVLGLSAGLSGVRNVSSVDLFDYRRLIVSVGVSARW